MSSPSIKTVSVPQVFVRYAIYIVYLHFRCDLVLCRKFRGLESRIAKEGGLKCDIKYWAGAWEAEEFINQL